jgi:hypothetical protein
MGDTTPFQFSNLVAQSLLQAIQAYQWGNAVPIDPGTFQGNLLVEVQGYGNNWPGSLTGTEQAQVDAAAALYSGFYAGLVNLAKTQPEPSNPTPEFDTWWQAQQTAQPGVS